MNLEKPKRLIIWNGGSTIYNESINIIFMCLPEYLPCNIVMAKVACILGCHQIFVYISLLPGANKISYH